MIIKCHLCNNTQVERSHFWKVHKIKLADYFVKYFPKYDLWDNQPIPFKNEEQYELTDFINKTNLKHYIQDRPEDEVLHYCKNYLKRLKATKELTYTPCQVELRSLLAPSIITFSRLFDYYEACEQLGYTKRFQHVSTDLLTLRPTNKTIYIDSREQKPILMPNCVVDKLDFGDYCTNQSYVFVERKSFSDFTNTMSQGFDRLCGELDRCQFMKRYMVILVECKLGEALTFNRLPWLNKFTNASPEFIFHRVRLLLQCYDNLQFFFIPGRKVAKRTLQFIFSNERLIPSFDLQYYHDSKK